MKSCQENTYSGSTTNDSERKKLSLLLLLNKRLGGPLEAVQDPLPDGPGVPNVLEEMSVLVNSGRSERGGEGADGDDELVVRHDEGLVGLLIGLLLAGSDRLGRVRRRSTDGTRRRGSRELRGRVGNGRRDGDGLSGKVW